MGTSVVFLLILFASMPLWHSVAEQNTPGEYYRVDPARFTALSDAFIEQYQVSDEGFPPVVRPPVGDVYLRAMQFAWTPVLELEKGETYRIHLSSTDVNHGFSLQPLNMNFQVVPGYDLVLTITPEEGGTYTILCNQFCGAGHHLMAGKIVVRQ